MNIGGEVLNKEIRTICYDEDLKLEAYQLKGIVQPFPNHFHDYYVIGFVESGTRLMSCKNKEYTITKGNILIFNPNDSHGCIQSDGEVFDYRGINISKDTMQSLTEEITGKTEFTENVIIHIESRNYLSSLHKMIMNGSMEFEKEEMLFTLISLLIEQYAQPFSQSLPICSEEVCKACDFMEKNYYNHITLNDLCLCSNLSKSTLLRAFTKAKGVTPYRYLQTIRINKAKELLEQGDTPVAVAMKTGFSDQSHFTNAFNMFIGLSPAVYQQIFKEKDNEK